MVHNMKHIRKRRVLPVACHVTLNELKIARMNCRLMPVEWVHRLLEEAALDLRKPIEIIGRNHPVYEQLILNGLDNAVGKVAVLLADDQAS